LSVRRGVVPLPHRSPRVALGLRSTLRPIARRGSTHRGRRGSAIFGEGGAMSGSAHNGGVHTFGGDWTIRKLEIDQS
ncbi:MAG: hypothetical protein ABFD65_05580, partial [Candidatus Polarisedimenticolia bacterium]